MCVGFSKCYQGAYITCETPIVFNCYYFLQTVISVGGSATRWSLNQRLEVSFCMSGGCTVLRAVPTTVPAKLRGSGLSTWRPDQVREVCGPQSGWQVGKHEWGMGHLTRQDVILVPIPVRVGWCGSQLLFFPPAKGDSMFYEPKTSKWIPANWVHHTHQVNPGPRSHRAAPNLSHLLWNSYQSRVTGRPELESTAPES